MTPVPHIWTVVPVKSLAAAKQRLSPLLNDLERQRLARAMFEDVLAACVSARLLAGIKPLLPPLGDLALDLDQPEDLARFLALPGTTRSHRVLLDLEVPLRLAPFLRTAAAEYLWRDPPFDQASL